MLVDHLKVDVRVGRRVGDGRGCRNGGGPQYERERAERTGEAEGRRASDGWAEWYGSNPSIDGSR